MHKSLIPTPLHAGVYQVSVGLDLPISLFILRSDIIKSFLHTFKLNLIKFRAAKLYEKALSKQNKFCLNRGFDLEGGWKGTPICILVNIFDISKNNLQVRYFNSI